MDGLFPEDQIKNKEVDRPWKKRDTDKMLDLYFGGAHPDRIGVILKCDPKVIKTRLEQFTHNERGRGDSYVPVERISRKGKRMTENERIMISAWKSRHFPLKPLSVVMQREPREMGVDSVDLSKLVEFRKIGVGVDLVMAYRYLYYVQGVSILSDQAYDQLEEEEKEFGVGSEILKELVGSDVADHYPPHIRALAMYLAFKYCERKSNE